MKRRTIEPWAALAIPALTLAQSFAPRGSQVFEVASVKPTPPNTKGTGVRPAPRAADDTLARAFHCALTFTSRIR